MNQYDKALEYAINNYQLGMYMRGEGAYWDESESKYSPDHVSVAGVLSSMYRKYADFHKLKEMAEQELVKMFSEDAEKCKYALAYLRINAFDTEEGESTFEFEIKEIYSQGERYIEHWKNHPSCESHIKKSIEFMQEDLRDGGYIK